MKRSQRLRLLSFPSLPLSPSLPPLRINALSLSDSMEMVMALLKSPLMNMRPEGRAREEGREGGGEGGVRKICFVEVVRNESQNDGLHEADTIDERGS